MAGLAAPRGPAPCCCAALGAAGRLRRADLPRGLQDHRDAAREVQRAVETVRLSAEQADRLEGQTLPFGDTPRGENRLGWYTREPVGVVAAITPFNDPLNLVAHKVGPALIGGNGGRPQARRADPAGRTRLRPAAARRRRSGRTAGRAPGPRRHRRGRPGGPPTGRPRLVHRRLRHRQRHRRRRRRQEDLDGARRQRHGRGAARCRRRRAAQAIVDGAFGNAGQNCLSVQRVFVAREVATSSSRSSSGTERLVVGSKADPRQSRPADRRGLR